MPKQRKRPFFGGCYKLFYSRDQKRGSTLLSHFKAFYEPFYRLLV